MVGIGGTNEIKGHMGLVPNHYWMRWYPFCLAIPFHSVTFFTRDGEGSWFCVKLKMFLSLFHTFGQMDKKNLKWQWNGAIRAVDACN